jgi:hypothetical protein
LAVFVYDCLPTSLGNHPAVITNPAGSFELSYSQEAFKLVPYSAGSEISGIVVLIAWIDYLNRGHLTVQRFESDMSNVSTGGEQWKDEIHNYNSFQYQRNYDVLIQYNLKHSLTDSNPMFQKNKILITYKYLANGVSS